jgi:hypothetical protein
MTLGPGDPFRNVDSSGRGINLRFNLFDLLDEQGRSEAAIDCLRKRHCPRGEKLHFHS